MSVLIGYRELWKHKIGGGMRGVQSSVTQHQRQASHQEIFP